MIFIIFLILLSKLFRFFGKVKIGKRKSGNREIRTCFAKE